MRHVIVAGLLLGAATTVPAAGQTLLDQLVQRVVKPHGASGAAPVQRGLVAPISPAQSAAIDRLLFAPLESSAIAADRVEAAPLIRAMVSLGSCATAPEAWNSINRVMMKLQTFRGYLPFLVPMMNMDHHDKVRCLDVIRIDSWTKPAKNAVRFKAWYVADDSGEAGHLVFELQKASDGQWLVRDFGSGLDA